jgi:predicted enzyme related to lactoylglutathione lyase
VNQPRYVHTNIIAQDWQGLARFYEQVLGCTPLPPGRSLGGPWLEAATNVPLAQIQGIHLRLPGHGDQGPTLEIFGYNITQDRPETATNRLGIGHMAFAVDDVDETLRAVLAAGGGTVGEMVSVEVAGAGAITFVYATDPEGNIIELQHWKE